MWHGVLTGYRTAALRHGAPARYGERRGGDPIVRWTPRVTDSNGYVTPGLLLAMNMTGDGIDVLVGAAISGDRSAITRLLASIQPLVVRYCRARVGRQERSYASADDVAQEVCLAVLTALPSYRDQGRPFLAFVYGIAAHKVADAHRSAARNKSEPVPEFPDSPELRDGPEQRAMNGELSDTMARLMSMLPSKQREILVLRVVVGLSAEETADAVGSTPGAVRVAQHRALNRLRKALAAEEVV
jgi:RNA polymerase sigma-70 factor, ECF subfamily